MKIGFALLSHAREAQALRLTNTLKTMFPQCAIVCHHNFAQAPGLNTAAFAGVQFVRDYVPTTWGHSSCIEASLKAFQLLCDAPQLPDWFYLLSETDYRIRPAGEILGDLHNATFNVFASHFKVSTDPTHDPLQEQRRWRYYRDTPPIFPAEFECFSGEHWFVADRKAIERLLYTAEHQPNLLQHYKSQERSKGTIIPEESYYQTVFCNAADLRVKNDCLRYIDWTQDGPSPKTLTAEDLPAILCSDAHFARKVELQQDPELFEMLDDACAGRIQRSFLRRHRR
jgi:hypothetical protein